MATGSRGPARLVAGAPQPVEQAELGVAVRLPRPVQLEVLVGQVGQDRDVVRDRAHPLEGQAVRCRLDDRDLVAGVDHRSKGRLQGGRLGGRRVLAVGDRRPADPGRDRAEHPGPSPGRLEGRDRAGRPSSSCRPCPVMPTTTQLVRRVALPPGGGAGQGRAARPRRRAGPRRARGVGVRRRERRRRASTASAAWSWPSIRAPVIATKMPPGRTCPRVVRDGRRHRPAGQRGRRDRPAVEAGRRGAGPRGRAARPARPGRAGAAPAAAAADGSVIGPHPGRARAATRPSPYRRHGSTRSWAPAISTHVGPERMLVLVQAGQRLAGRRSAGGRDRCRRRPGPSRRGPRGSPAGSPASGAGASPPDGRIAHRARRAEWTVDRRRPWR